MMPWVPLAIVVIGLLALGCARLRCHFKITHGVGVRCVHLRVTPATPKWHLIERERKPDEDAP